jgi:23S rRNA (uracil1939-C5)-methyltransferase
VRALAETHTEAVRITALADDGRGVARISGVDVFVDGALPGECVEVVRVRRRRRRNEARMTALIEASADRVQPICAHFGQCGGCSLQHLRPRAQLRAKQDMLLDRLMRLGDVAPERVFEPLGGPTSAYRRRARLGVRFVEKKGRVLVGFRERYKPYVADLDTCPVLTPPADRLLGPLAELIGALSIRRRLAQVEVCVADNRAAFVLRVLDLPTVADRSLMQAFETEHDVDLYLQPRGPDSAEPLTGPAEPLWFELPDFELRLHVLPTDFMQVNGGLNRHMVRRAMELLVPSAGQRVLDLFCGLGNFTLPVARLGARVTGLEGDAALVARARRNAERNELDALADFHMADLSGDCAGVPWLSEDHDAVFLDPPRAGAAAVLQHVAAHGVARIVYVSCHADTLARDAGLLAKQFGYRLAGVGVMDMFPHTTHVESIALLERG